MTLLRGTLLRGTTSVPTLVLVGSSSSSGSLSGCSSISVTGYPRPVTMTLNLSCFIGADDAPVGEKSCIYRLWINEDINDQVNMIYIKGGGRWRVGSPQTPTSGSQISHHWQPDISLGNISNSPQLFIIDDLGTLH